MSKFANKVSVKTWKIKRRFLDSFSGAKIYFSVFPEDMTLVLGHSCRNRPSNVSMKALSVGFPGQLKSSSTSPLTVDVPDSGAGLCRDIDDKPFVDLAVAREVDVLVSLTSTCLIATDSGIFRFSALRSS